MKQKPIRRSVVVCEAAPKKKADSAAKQARQADKRRIYNKAKKSEVKTRMKKFGYMSMKDMIHTVMLSCHCSSQVQIFGFPIGISVILISRRVMLMMLQMPRSNLKSVRHHLVKRYSVIDKAVKVGTQHGNTGARRKSWLARRKKAVEIHHGWYTPAPAENAA
ncbi:30S ribosomal protein S20 [Hibiscus syriacus]|uniref:30S ribosomal protein S20 n=1 Tax=Hibiscus syriacus TaxID=106335 RepID=A0A6A3CYH9_HIBSY|nr:30S ribosomal protein S20 [Hibiscus syriacus]